MVVGLRLAAEPSSGEGGAALEGIRRRNGWRRSGDVCGVLQGVTDERVHWERGCWWRAMACQ
ncbi:hypothetical protein E2562_002231 [Oryza meyeriana var. granulata]|uniref:Uncharacterized protein n=1 Tax=Oryza meyeriana var. granulata TaxID=110450 RepID=A0A6G1BHV2_9ORYZ|nr:hypothetical protein E2562_002231 [Oryza meyeriana var. granulata]